MRRGFTLLEMTVVIAILALMTHLAMRELGQYRDNQRSAAADKQLEDIRDAAQAFMRDIGRLPRLAANTNENGEVVWTLSELWQRPAGIAARHIKTKDGVSVAVGWDGPYLRMPFSRTRLLDPWGNPIEAEDSAGLVRLMADNDGYVTNVCHYGASAQATGRKAIALASEGGTSATLMLSIDAGDYSGDVKCGWYGGYENAITNVTHIAAAGEQFVFTNVPYGVKWIVIEAGKMFVRTVDVKEKVTVKEFKVR